MDGTGQTILPQAPWRNSATDEQRKDLQGRLMQRQNAALQEHSSALLAGTNVTPDET